MYFQCIHNLLIYQEYFDIFCLIILQRFRMIILEILLVSDLNSANC